MSSSPPRPIPRSSSSSGGPARHAAPPPPLSTGRASSLQATGKQLSVGRLQRKPSQSRAQRFMSPTNAKNDGIKLSLLLCGDGVTGKSSILRNITQKPFMEEHEPSAALDFTQKQLKVGDYRVGLTLWKTPHYDGGQREIKGSVCKALHGAFVVCSATDASSFEGVGAWKMSLDERTGRSSGESAGIPVALLINKIDLSMTEAQRPSYLQPAYLDGLCVRHGLSCWFFTSAKEGLNVGLSLATMLLRVLPRAAEKVDASQMDILSAQLEERLASGRGAAKQGGKKAQQGGPEGGDGATSNGVDKNKAGKGRFAELGYFYSTESVGAIWGPSPSESSLSLSQLDSASGRVGGGIGGSAPGGVEGGQQGQQGQGVVLSRQRTFGLDDDTVFRAAEKAAAKAQGGCCVVS